MFGEACFISKVNLTSASSHRESDPIDHLTAPELEHGLDAILRSPPTDGRLELLVDVRPSTSVRFSTRASSTRPKGSSATGGEHGAPIRTFS